MEGQLYEKFVSYCADYNYRGSELENKRELLKSLYALVLSTNGYKRGVIDNLNCLGGLLVRTSDI